MTEDTGVTTRTATRITLIEAIRDARPEATGWRGRRRAAIGDAELADAILGRLPEADPAASRVADSAGAIIAERDAEIAGLRDRCDGQFATIRSLREHAARAEAEAAEVFAGIERLLADTTRAEARLAVAVAALERFAAAGSMSAPARRRQAADVLAELTAEAAGEQVAPDEPA